ncbi:acetyl-CoA C-acetyltransferase [Variovorax boronicumulans]|uniref:acyl-CoA dehydrogenase family protein n=1 Tax=Variovorax boronicumulans TaxID=436515 RepID=UPI00278AE2A6|nr:acyl-CoA dehydrogenase family protein [Variovorax boronicumulans]MDP9917409.1 acetyl-CoA C-acetyltransferase [Variovorax boronicumulans]
MNDTLLDDFERPLRALCTDDTLRAVEGGAPADALWRAIDALGYTDALVAEAQGGAGLSLRELFALVFAAGRAGLGLPFGETAVARALLAAAGHGGRHGSGPVAIAPGALGGAGDGAIVCRDVPGGALAQQVLVSWQGEWLLLPRERATATPGAWRAQASATLRWQGAHLAVVRFDAGGADAVALCNALHAAGMAGAMDRVLELTGDYARDRKQFGRPIAQFQAVQQELSVLGEQAHSATLAARLGCSAAGVRPDPLLAATAKLRTCEAARSVCAIAHAVFGAIGITEEHVLGLYTRRLHEWRAAPGTETQCARLLGEALLGQTEGLFDFVRLRLSAPAFA